MTNVVPADQIEEIVGVPRHRTEHWGRVVADATADVQTVYILHSGQCRERLEDLRECQFSLALDRVMLGRGPGIDGWPVAAPMRLAVQDGLLVPVPANPHQPVFEWGPVVDERTGHRSLVVRCAAEGCPVAWFTQGLGEDPQRDAWQREHADQYEPGRAPNIEIDWTPSAVCPICDDWVDLSTIDSETLECPQCHTTWSMDGHNGQRPDEQGE